MFPSCRICHRGNLQPLLPTRHWGGTEVPGLSEGALAGWCLCLPKWWWALQAFRGEGSCYTVTGKHWQPYRLCLWMSWESSFRKLFEVLHFPWCREETQSHRAAWLLIQSKKRCWSKKGCSIFYIRAALCSALLTGKKSLCVSGGLACFDFWHCSTAVIAVRLLIASCIVWTYPRTLTVPAAVSTCLWDESLGLLNPSWGGGRKAQPQPLPVAFWGAQVFSDLLLFVCLWRSGSWVVNEMNKWHQES